MHPDYDSRINTFYSRIRTPVLQPPGGTLLPQMGGISDHTVDCQVKGRMPCSKATSNKRKSSPRANRIGMLGSRCCKLTESEPFSGKERLGPRLLLKSEAAEEQKAVFSSEHSNIDLQWPGCAHRGRARTFGKRITGHPQS